MPPHVTVTHEGSSVSSYSSSSSSSSFLTTPLVLSFLLGVVISSVTTAAATAYLLYTRDKDDEETQQCQPPRYRFANEAQDQTDSTEEDTTTAAAEADTANTGTAKSKSVSSCNSIISNEQMNHTHSRHRQQQKSYNSLLSQGFLRWMGRNDINSRIGEMPKFSVVASTATTTGTNDDRTVPMTSLSFSSHSSSSSSGMRTRWPWDRKSRNTSPSLSDSRGSNRTNTSTATATATAAAATTAATMHPLLKVDRNGFGLHDPFSSSPVVEFAKEETPIIDHSHDHVDEEDSSIQQQQSKSEVCIGSIFGLDVGGTLAKLVYFEQKSEDSACPHDDDDVSDCHFDSETKFSHLWHNNSAHRSPSSSRSHLHPSPPPHRSPHHQKSSSLSSSSSLPSLRALPPISSSFLRGGKWYVDHDHADDRDHDVSNTSLPPPSPSTGIIHATTNTTTTTTTTTSTTTHHRKNRGSRRRSTSLAEQLFLRSTDQEKLKFDMNHHHHHHSNHNHNHYHRSNSSSSSNNESRSTTSRPAVNDDDACNSILLRKSTSMLDVRGGGGGGGHHHHHHGHHHHPDQVEALDRFYSFARRTLDDAHHDYGIKDHTLSFYSRQLGGELHFIRFESRRMPHAMDLIRENQLHHNIRIMGATGGGAHRFATQWEQELGITMTKHDELDSLVAGMQFVLSTVVGECYTYRPDDRRNPTTTTTTATSRPPTSTSTKDSNDRTSNKNHNNNTAPTTSISDSTNIEQQVDDPVLDEEDVVVDEEPSSSSSSSSHDLDSAHDDEDDDHETGSRSNLPHDQSNGSSSNSHIHTHHHPPTRKKLFYHPVDERWWSRKVQRRDDRIADAAATTTTYPYLLVTIGTGVSIVRVDGPGQHVRVSGSTIGGGTYWGLIRLLTDLEDFDAVMRLAERGDTTKIDMMVGDIYGHASNVVEKMGLSSDLVASSFGKLVSKDDPAADLKEEDLARALLLMITINIGQVAYLNAQLHQTSRIYFAGNFLRENKISQRRLCFAIDYWSKGEMEALFLEHEGYFGALGAFLLSQGSGSSTSTTTPTQSK